MQSSPPPLGLLAQTDPAANPVEAASVWLEHAEALAFEYGPRVLAALVILVVGWIAARAAGSAVRRIGARARFENTLSSFMANLTQMAVLTFTGVAAISKLGVETASLIAVLGAAGFAVGFALQGSLSNFAAGVLLMIFRPLRKDDLVEAGGAMGVVHEVGVFATTINSLDNKRVTVSNSAVMGGNIVNYSINPTRRVDMVFGIGYRSDFEQAREILLGILRSNPLVLADPAPKVAMVGLGDSSVNLVCRPWCKPEHYWDVHFAVHEAVKREFDARGIQIPFPQRDVHLFQSPPAA